MRHSDSHSLSEISNLGIFLERSELCWPWLRVRYVLFQKSALIC